MSLVVPTRPLGVACYVLRHLLVPAAAKDEAASGKQDAQALCALMIQSGADRHTVLSLAASTPPLRLAVPL